MAASPVDEPTTAHLHVLPPVEPASPLSFYARGAEELAYLPFSPGPYRGVLLDAGDYGEGSATEAPPPAYTNGGGGYRPDAKQKRTFTQSRYSVSSEESAHLPGTAESPGSETDTPDNISIIPKQYRENIILQGKASHPRVSNHPTYDVYDEHPPEIVRRYRAELAATVVEGQTLLAALLWQPSTPAMRRAIVDILRRIEPERYLDDHDRVTVTLRIQSLWVASAVIEAILAEQAVPRRRWRRLRRWGKALSCRDGHDV